MAVQDYHAAAKKVKAYNWLESGHLHFTNRNMQDDGNPLRQSNRSLQGRLNDWATLPLIARVFALEAEVQRERSESLSTRMLADLTFVLGAVVAIVRSRNCS